MITSIVEYCQQEKRKKIGIVGYWATSISTVRTTVLSENVLKRIYFRIWTLLSGFWILSRIGVIVAVRLLSIILDSYGVVFSRWLNFFWTSYVYNQLMSILLSDKPLLELPNEMINQIISFLPKHPMANMLFYHIYYRRFCRSIPRKYWLF